MKKVLAVVLAVAIMSVVSFNAQAQVPNLAVYFDGTNYITSKNCPNAPVGTVIDKLEIVLNNANAWVSAVEFTLSLPASMLYTGDIHQNGALNLGISPTGVAISWPLPQSAFGALLVMQAQFFWMCDGCSNIAHQNGLVDILAFPSSGQIRAVDWPNGNVITLVGAPALVCPTGVPVQDKTWGAIKSLYTD
jgi:hypothetical protein